MLKQIAMPIYSYSQMGGLQTEVEINWQQKEAVLSSDLKVQTIYRTNEEALFKEVEVLPRKTESGDMHRMFQKVRITQMALQP